MPQGKSDPYVHKCTDLCSVIRLHIRRRNGLRPYTPALTDECSPQASSERPMNLNSYSANNGKVVVYLPQGALIA